jgi:glycosyltransferase involved in cell wall biosynthesis
LAQTLPPDEVVVVDDASTDATTEVVEALGDARVRLVRLPERRGAPTARNAGLDQAAGDVVGFLDSDDEWAPRRLERQVTEVPGAGLLACGFIVRRPSSTVRAAPGCFRGSDPGRRLLRLRGGPLTTSCLMVDRRAGTRDTRFDAGLPALQDLDFAIRATAAGGLGHVRDALVIKHTDHGERVFNPVNEVAARRMLLDLYRDDLGRDPQAAAAHHLALARALARRDGVAHAGSIVEALDAAVEAWPALATRAMRIAWRQRGPSGLQAACRLWWFLAEDPIGRVRNRAVPAGAVHA